MSDEKSPELSISVCGNKYRFQMHDGDYRVHVLRYGEPWLVLEQGHNAIAALLYDYADLARRAAWLEEQLSGGGGLT